MHGPLIQFRPSSERNENNLSDQQQERSAGFSYPSETEPSSEISRPPPVKDCTTTTTTSTSEIAAQSSDLPLWQRLPSRNVSFSSAEVLLVNECYEHMKDYLDKSVRITGVVLDTYFHTVSGKVSLIIGDPLAFTSQNIDSKTVCSSNLTGHNRSYYDDGSRKRPRSEATAAEQFSSTADGFPQWLERNTSGCTVWVLVDPSYVHFHPVQKEDLVSVIGEIRRWEHGSTDEEATHSKSSSFSSLPLLIDARIFQNANGTNMSLHRDALLARRKFLRNILPAGSIGLGPS